MEHGKSGHSGSHDPIDTARLVILGLFVLLIAIGVIAVITH